MIFSGLEHPSADVHLTVCPTEPLGLYIVVEKNVFIPHFHIQVIHTDTYRYIQYIHIHTSTYTYIHIHITSNQCREGFLCCSGGCTRSLCTELPTQIISDGAQGVLAEREMRVECLLAAQGVHFGPQTRAARAGAPKRVRGWVFDGGKKWSATCPGVP